MNTDDKKHKISNTHTKNTIQKTTDTNDKLVTLKVFNLAKKKGYMHSKQSLYIRPSQSYLQKWLRETKNINLCLKPVYGDDKMGEKQTGWQCYTLFQDEYFNKIPSISLIKYIYEEALEKGLKQALELCPNCI
ncbi:MAG: hypothetical protein ACJA2M_000324 [Polaribacter sp.]|jgi:hypothetical protein